MNRSAKAALDEMKATSLDGKGHVFFKGGVGIVYPNGLKVEESKVEQASTCVSYRPETLISQRTCAIREISSFATYPKIYSPAAPLYINGVKAVVCPGKVSALFSLTELFEQNRDQSPCRNVSPDSLSALPASTYAHVVQGVRDSRGVVIGQPALEWANIMPVAR